MWSVVAVVSLAVLVLAALGVVSCLVSHRGMGGEPPHSTLPMLALHSGMERLRLEAGMGAGRPERQSAHGVHPMHGVHGHGTRHGHPRRTVDCAVDRAVRLAAVSADLQLDLPPSIALPDGEEIPYGASSRLHIRDPEQESEIYQKCIRPPPNRTVFDGESPPPYRPHSAGTLRPPAPAGPSPGPCPGPSPSPSPSGASVHASAAGHIPAVIVPSPPRPQAQAAPAGKHSTPLALAPHPAPPCAPPPCSASGLLRLLTPSPAADRVERVDRAVTVPVSSRTAQSENTCHPPVRDGLASLTMVPCLTESRADAEAESEAEGPGRTRTRTRAGVGSLPRPPV